MNFKRLLLFIVNIFVIYSISLLLKSFVIQKLIGKYFTNGDNFFSLLLVENDGAAFNILSGHVDLLVIFASFILLCCLVYVVMSKFFISKKRFILLSFFCTGILGNACERFLYDCVTDYFKINLLNFPVFNLYDIFITLGAILIAFNVIEKKSGVSEI